MIRVFNHYIPAAIVILIIIEAIILGTSIYAGASIRFGQIDLPSSTSLEGLRSTALAYTLLMLMSMTTFGLYQRDFLGGVEALMIRLLASFTVGFGAMSLMFYLIPNLYLGRGAFGFGFFISLFAIFVARILFLKWADLDILKTRILVIGTGASAKNVETLANCSGSAKNTTIVGYLALQDGEHQVEASRILLQEKRSLVEVVARYGINEILLAVADRRSGGLPLTELLDCKYKGVRVTELSSFFERERGQVRLDSNASWLILGEGFNNNTLRDAVKRGFDVIASLLLLSFALPVIFITAILIRLESSGPVFYRQERVGEHGKTFRIYKFRSMQEDAEKDGQPRWAETNDGRITQVGRVIRKLRIDELPQIINVLKGEMSFVGPRPERPFFVAQLATEIPYYQARHSIKPGITGWAQVRYPYGASVTDAEEKLQYDLYYVKNHSLFLDIMILLDTLQVVLWGKGAR